MVARPILSAAPGAMAGRRYHAMPRRRRMDPTIAALAPAWTEILAMSGLFVFYLLADLLFGESIYPTVNLTGPLVMVAILAWGGWRLLRVNGTNIWTALLWFRLSTSVYYGIGTYAIFIMNNYTRSYVEAFFEFFDHEVFKLNLIVTLSVAIVLAVARLWILRVARREGRSKPNSHAAAQQNENALFAAALFFLVVGLTINYALVLPNRMGFVSFELPGAIQNLSKMTFVGVFTMTLWSRRNARWLLPILTGLVAIEMIFQLLIFSKYGILMVLIMYLLAFLWDRVTLKRLTLFGLIIVTSFATLQPLIGYARHEINLRYGGNKDAGFGERFNILTSYYTTGAASVIASTSEHQNALSRISYVNMGTFAIHLYDRGDPSDWPSLLPAVFVPRILWPGKPIITDVGIDLNEMATGYRTSSSAAGLFVDPYWAMGWWGVVIFMILYGFILAVLTVMTARLLRDGRWIFFPIILQAMLMGFRTDGLYISDVAGVSVLLVYYYAFFVLLEKVLANRSGKVSPRHSR